MSPPTRKAQILTAAGFAALLVLAAAFLWLREGAREPSARPSAEPAAPEDASSSLASANVSGDERESLQVEPEVASPDATSTASDEAKNPRVVVAVRDSDQAPVPGAQVEVTGQGPLGQWTCDAEGRCKLPVEPWTGGLDLRVTAKGFVTTCRSGGRSEEIVVVLHHAAVARGRVVAAEDDSPIADAKVSLGVIACGEAEVATHTNAAGEFELSGLPLQDGLPWWVSADGFATLYHRMELRDPSQELKLELSRGVRLEFLVVDAQTEAPIEGATIRDVGEATTDARGRASTTALISVDDERSLLRVSAPGYCALRVPIRASELDLNSVLRLPLLLGARLEGSVNDSGGQGIPDIEVQLSIDSAGRRRSSEQRPDPFREVALPEGWRLEGSRGDQVTTDVNGRFELQGLEPSSRWYQVELSRKGVDLTSPQPVPPLGPAGSTTQTQITVDLAATCVVTGTMTLNGTPARGFVSWRGPTRRGGQLAGLDGRFRLENVEPGHVALAPMPDGLIKTGECELFPGPWTVDASSGGEVDVDIPLELEMSSISGRVTDAQGVPQAGAKVMVLSRDGCWAAQGTSSEEGSFELAVRAGAWKYDAQAERGHPNAVRVEDVLAGTRDLELVLPGKGTLRIRAVDARTRTALTSYVLRFKDEDGEARVVDSRTSVVPDPQGWFRLDLKPGTHRLFVSDPDGERTIYLPADAGTVIVQESSKPQQLEFERERGLELDVLLAEGQEPWPQDAFVLLLEPATMDQVVLDKSGWNIGQAYRGINVVASRSLRLDRQGRARATALRPGPHRFVAFPDTIAIEPAEVVVTGAESEPLEIRWKPR